MKWVNNIGVFWVLNKQKTTNIGLKRLYNLCSTIKQKRDLSSEFRQKTLYDCPLQDNLIANDEMERERKNNIWREVFIQAIFTLEDSRNVLKKIWQIQNQLKKSADTYSGFFTYSDVWKGKKEIIFLKNESR